MNAPVIATLTVGEQTFTPTPVALEPPVQGETEATLHTGIWLTPFGLVRLGFDFWAMRAWVQDTVNALTRSTETAKIETASVDELRRAEALHESNALVYARMVKDEKQRLTVVRRQLRKVAPAETAR